MEKTTNTLTNILKKTHLDEFDTYISDNKDAFIAEVDSFEVYIKELLREKKLTHKRVFIDANIPEGYGRKLLSGEKKTYKRDIIIRICYAANLSVDETQKALKKYGLPELYPKVARDALLIILINEHRGDIYDINAHLKEQGMVPLEECGN